ncbi:hypothetical protein K6485_06635 [Escherichia ruysiae]|uniref:Uncharacterized protein n=1 Tax=Escherichia ruysiae TaxID=2608867 RepID=A0ABU1DMU1_9ESCH|nr:MULTISPECIES: hypothetical protein [Escherichia]MBY7621158.1 hypothetical protein [Escherichia marmotae]MBY7186810.1 hypothetical protein [Escherichia ruysiae]MBY7193370.1 hypothetical protein [Escherichia ruysiae]MBY7220047.1 hypothetical protein [Escherichia ruysiae]MBY7279948.1 hypothetical protein [Escherichia ruysiae]
MLRNMTRRLDYKIIR